MFIDSDNSFTCGISESMVVRYSGTGCYGPEIIANFTASSPNTAIKD